MEVGAIMLPKCPYCNSTLRPVQGQFGWFLGCPNFHKLKCNCGISLPDDIQAELDRDHTTELDFTGLIPDDGAACPDCQSSLILKHGEFGFFHSCLAYPGCCYTAQIPEDSETEDTHTQIDPGDNNIGRVPPEPTDASSNELFDLDRFKLTSDHPLHPDYKPKPPPGAIKDLSCPRCSTPIKLRPWGKGRSEDGKVYWEYRCTGKGCHHVWQPNPDGSPKKVSIYGLYDTRPGKEGLRYVGQTRSALKDRRSGHLTDSRKKGSTAPKNRWIKELREEGFTPKIELLERVFDFFGDVSEQMWMSAALDCGIDLTNSVLGDHDGNWIFSERCRERMRLREHERYLQFVAKRTEPISLAIKLSPDLALRLEEYSFARDPVLSAKDTKTQIITEALELLLQ